MSRGFPTGLLAFFLFRWIANRRVSALVIVGLLALFINLPQYVRNFRTTGSPLGSTSSFVGGTRAQWVGPGVVVLGPLRQASLNLGLPGLQARLTDLLVKIHHALSIEPSDSRITLGQIPFQAKGWLRHEDSIGNPVDLLVGVWVICFTLARDGPEQRTYALLCLISALTFSLLLKWQPWGTRLQLPLFVLLCPLVALWLRRLPYRLVGLGLALRVLFILYVACWNENKPLLATSPGRIPWQEKRSVFFQDRSTSFFNNCVTGARQDYQNAIEYLRIHGAERVGLFNVDYPYLLFVLDETPKTFQFEYLETEFGEKSPHAPSWLLAHSQANELERGGRLYKKVLGSNTLTVYLLDPVR